MSQSLQCPTCQRKLKLRPDKQRFHGKCPGCGAELHWERPQDTLDAAVSDTSGREQPIAVNRKSIDKPASDVDRMRDLLAAFDGKVTGNSAGFSYRLTVLLTFAAIIVLFLAYFCIVTAGAYGLYWYGFNILPGAFEFRGRIMVFLFVLHVSVLFAGLATLFAMVSPIFFRVENESRDDVITLRDAPLLHSFVNKIADSLNAPRPNEICVTTHVNASASFHGGLLGLFGKRMTLTIGGPLISGMNMQQLAGVIAHELGHFSQNGGTALRSFVLRFAIWCYSATVIQEGVAESVKEGEVNETGSEKILRFVLWSTQSIGSLCAQAFSYIGLYMTMFVSRQLEYDADRYEAELAGSDAFFGTSRRMVELSLGQKTVASRGMALFAMALSSADVVRDLAINVVAEADAAPESTRKLVERELQTPTGIFDSHPGLKDRVAAVKANSRPGIFHLQRPAWELYPRFCPKKA